CESAHNLVLCIHYLHILLHVYTTILGFSLSISLMSTTSQPLLFSFSKAFAEYSTAEILNFCDTFPKLRTLPGTTIASALFAILLSLLRLTETLDLLGTKRSLCTLPQSFAFFAFFALSIAASQELI